MAKLKLIWVILSKELLDNMRDRRSVFNAMVAVLLNPLLYIALFSFMARANDTQSAEILQLPVIGSQNAPNLVAFLAQNGVDIVPVEDGRRETVTAGVRAGDIDVVLVIPPDYEAQLRSGQPAELELLADRSNQGASVSRRRVETLLSGYNRQLASLRLLARGISPQVILPAPVSVVDVAPQEQSVALATLSLLPTVMITAAFFGGFYLAVDMTAGERERKSLEPLLINPVPRWLFVLGKFLAAFLFTMVATFLATALFLLMLAWPVVQDFMGIRFTLDTSLIGTAMALMTPVVFMAVALEILVAAYTKSVKEAQTYTQILALGGFLPTVMLSVLPVNAQPWMTFIPTISQLFLLQQAARNEFLPPLDVITASVVTILVGLAALVLTVRLYRREEIIQGGSS